MHFSPQKFFQCTSLLWVSGFSLLELTPPRFLFRETQNFFPHFRFSGYCISLIKNQVCFTYSCPSSSSSSFQTDASIDLIFWLLKKLSLFCFLTGYWLQVTMYMVIYLFLNFWTVMLMFLWLWFSFSDIGGKKKAMLRKRSRAMPLEQEKARQMGDLVSNSCFAFDFAATQKARTSLFSIPGLFEGFTTKCLPDSDSVSSPTTPLDHRIFSNLAGSFLRSPRSRGRSWDCSRIGLGLVDSFRIDDKALGRSESKNILLGSQMRSKTPLSSSGDEKHGKYDSSSSVEACKIDHNPKVNSSVLASDLKNPHMGSLPSFRGRLESNFFSGSLPVSLDSKYGSMGVTLSASEIELSEDYTCIISHGPNPKTTHIFGDCILENYMKGDGGGLDPFLSNDFLNFCFFCKKKLKVGKDIYMYRGERAFCSCNCRDQGILFEEELEMKNTAAVSCDSPRSPSFHEDLFLEGMAVSS